MLPNSATIRGSDPYAPDFFDGWYGYVCKDLRDLFGREGAAGAYSRVYCGGGSQSAVPRGAAESLREALKVTPQQLYGHGDCAERPAARPASTRTARSPPGSRRRDPVPEPPDVPADGLGRQDLGP